MVSNKGFLHVIETIIAAIIVVSLIPILLQTYHTQENWERVELRNTGEDIIRHLETTNKLNNLSEYSEAEIEAEINNILGTRSMNIQYNIRTENTYKSEIDVGLVCGGCDINEIRSLFSPVRVNDRWIEYHIDYVDNLNNTENKDLILLFDEDGVREGSQNKTSISSHVGKGRGILQFTNMDPGLFVETSSLQEDIFGISGASSTTVSDEIEFNNTEDVTKANYEPKKIFYAVPTSVKFNNSLTNNWSIRNNTYEVNISDNNFDQNTEITITKEGNILQNVTLGDEFTIDGFDFEVSDIHYFEEGVYSDVGYVWFKPKEDYEFYGFLKNDITLTNPENKVLQMNDSPGLAINHINDGKAAWLPLSKEDDVQALLQTAAIWSSGKGEWNYYQDHTDREAVQVSRFAVGSKDLLEPKKVVINLWYTF